MKNYTHAGFSPDAPDGQKAFVWASTTERDTEGIYCETSDFADALGMDHDDVMETISHIVENGNPNAVAAIINVVIAERKKAEELKEYMNNRPEPLDILKEAMKGLNPSGYNAG